MHQDQKTVSNEFHELEYVAKKFNLPVWQVMKAKEELGTNERAAVYEHLQGVKSLQEASAKADMNKPAPVVITEDDIADAAVNYAEDTIAVGDKDFLLEVGFTRGANWMRDQLTREAKS